MPVPESTSAVPRFVKVLLAFELTVASVYILDRLTGSPIHQLSKFFDLAGEDNLPTWFSSVQWFAIAALFGLFAHRNLAWRNPRSWLLLGLPLVFALLSMDEVVEIHEWLGSKTDILLPSGTREGTVFFRTGIWMFVIGIPFLGAFVALIWSLKDYFRRGRGALVKLLSGMFVMLTGAVGVEALYNFIPAGSRLGLLQVVVEEGMEMAGATIVLWSAWDLLRSYGFCWTLEAAATETTPSS